MIRFTFARCYKLLWLTTQLTAKIPRCSSLSKYRKISTSTRIDNFRLISHFTLLRIFVFLLRYIDYKRTFYLFDGGSMAFDASFFLYWHDSRHVKNSALVEIIFLGHFIFVAIEITKNLYTGEVHQKRNIVTRNYFFLSISWQIRSLLSILNKFKIGRNNFHPSFHFYCDPLKNRIFRAAACRKLKVNTLTRD